MTSAVERIKREIRSLAPDEVEELLRDLQNEYVLPPQNGEDATTVAAEWDAEIDRRMKDVVEGRVELISGEESDRRIDAVFARHGLQRRTA